jgi:hypothetical protein
VFLYTFRTHAFGLCNGDDISFTVRNELLFRLLINVGMFRVTAPYASGL